MHERRRESRLPRVTIAIVATLAALLGVLVVTLSGHAARRGQPQAIEVSSLRAAARGGAQGRASTSRKHRRRHPHRRSRRRSVRVVGPPGPAGPPGEAGPPGPQVAIPLTVNWHGTENATGHDIASGQVAGIGTLTATCNTTTQTLSLTPVGNGGRSVLDVTTYQGEGTSGASSNQRLESESTEPISIELPNNGMVSGTISAEPIAGNGGAPASPATFLLSSEWKNNDPEAANDFCYVAVQVLGQR